MCRKCSDVSPSRTPHGFVRPSRRSSFSLYFYAQIIYARILYYIKLNESRFKKLVLDDTFLLLSRSSTCMLLVLDTVGVSQRGDRLLLTVEANTAAMRVPKRGIGVSDDPHPAGDSFGTELIAGLFSSALPFRRHHWSHRLQVWSVCVCGSQRATPVAIGQCRPRHRPRRGARRCSLMLCSYR